MRTSPRRLELTDITAEAFAPFGDLIETRGDVARRDCVARIANGRAQATANLAVVRALAQAPSLEGLRGWRVRGTQAISYRTGAWHTPMTVLAGTGLFAVLVFEEGTADDTHLRPVAPFMVVP
ncbi:MAG: ureidoglycolate lyase [Acetobacteraceae bacterium]|nr:ureidoglycolate lyase [Acetobacteraceae bacterium]